MDSLLFEHIAFNVDFEIGFIQFQVLMKDLNLVNFGCRRVEAYLVGFNRFNLGLKTFSQVFLDFAQIMSWTGQKGARNVRTTSKDYRINSSFTLNQFRSYSFGYFSALGFQKCIAGLVTSKHAKLGILEYVRIIKPLKLTRTSLELHK